MQEVFLVVHRRLASYGTKAASIRSWIYGILLRVVARDRRTFRRKYAPCSSKAEVEGDGLDTVASQRPRCLCRPPSIPRPFAWPCACLISSNRTNARSWLLLSGRTDERPRDCRVFALEPEHCVRAAARGSPRCFRRRLRSPPRTRPKEDSVSDPETDLLFEQVRATLSPSRRRTYAAFGLVWPKAFRPRPPLRLSLQR